MQRAKRYHLHCDGCGYVRQYDEPVLAPERCGRCRSSLISCTDMETGVEVRRKLDRAADAEPVTPKQK